jgi:hypothetical protein
MKYQEFYLRTTSTLSKGKILQNPGGGRTTITRYTDTHMVYRRRNSEIRVSMRDLYTAYRTFSGKEVSSTDLREYMPKVYSKSGHPCNCTLLFMVFKAIGVVTMIEGEGKRGSPFRVTIIS